MSGKYQFETTVLTLTIAGVLIKLRTVLHPETLFDQMLEKGNNHDDVVNERIPYWAELWPASIAMAEFLLNNRHLSEGKRLLEIGCGLGLAGIGANLSNAQVTISDYLQEAVDLAKINWRLNFDTPPNVRLLDWHFPPDGEKFEIIIGADVLYDKMNHSALSIFFDKMLVPGGIIILTDPKRSATGRFFELPKMQEYRNLQHTITVTNKGATSEIDIFVLQKI